MPCRVDLTPLYSYYDWNDRANYLFFKTPLVPILCEAMKVLECNEMVDELPKYVRDIAKLWKEEHDKCDRSEEYLADWNKRNKILMRFHNFEKEISKR